MIACTRLAKWGAGAAAVLVMAACSAAPEDDAAKAAHNYGWMHAIASYNTTLPVTKPLGHAESTIAGHSIRSIINDATVRIRGDNRACVECHPWAAQVDKHTFCTTHIAEFLAQPTLTGSNDPPNAKPAILKELLTDWKSKGCPD